MTKSSSNSSRTLTVVALCGLFLGASAWQSSFGATETLNFTSTTPGTIDDSFSVGTGFTTRLSGTDSANPDSRLTLNTGGTGTLSITGSSVGTDFNGQTNVGLLEAPGIDLASLGYTGTQDFSLTATFLNVPAAAFQDYSQFGLYVGTASNNLTRDGFVYASGAGGANFFTNINTGGDASNIAGEPAFVAGDNLTVTISRTGGVFTETVGGNTIAIPGDPQANFGLADLTVGVFSANTTAGDSFTSTLDSFTATVVTPEPSTWAMMLGGLAMLVAFQRLRARRTQV
jgi:hypothetical protein